MRHISHQASWLVRFQGLNFRTQRWLLIFALCLQAALATGYLILTRERLDADQERTLRNTALLQANTTELQLDAMRYQLRFLGTLVLRDHVVRGDALRHLLQEELKREWVDTFVLLDRDGRFVAVESLIPSEKVVFAQYLKDGGFYNNPLYQHFRANDIDEDIYFKPGSDGDPTGEGFVIYKAIRDTQGQFVGAIYGFLASRTLERFVLDAKAQGFDLGQDGVVSIVDQATGRTLSRFDQRQSGRAHLPNANKENLQAARPDARTIQVYQSPVDQVIRLGSFMQINQGRWVQLIAVSQNDYLQGWYWQIAIAIVLFVLLAWLQWHVLDYSHSNLLQRKQLAHESRHDPLTGLANRRHFNEWALSACNLAQHHQQPLSILSLDLDFFKKVNDSYGHDGGDAVLKHTARTLQAALRESDIAARFGGEEFIVALPHTSLAEAVAVAERIRSALAEQAVAFNGQMILVTASIGATEVAPTELAAAEGMSRLEPALARADEALYASKQGGRNRVTTRTL